MKDFWIVLAVIAVLFLMLRRPKDAKTSLAATAASSTPEADTGPARILTMDEETERQKALIMAQAQENRNGGD